MIFVIIKIKNNAEVKIERIPPKFGRKGGKMMGIINNNVPSVRNEILK